MLEDMDDINSISFAKALTSTSLGVPDFHEDTHDQRNEQGDLLKVSVHDNSLECYIHII